MNILVAFNHPGDQPSSDSVRRQLVRPEPMVCGIGDFGNRDRREHRNRGRDGFHRDLRPIEIKVLTAHRSLPQCGSATAGLADRINHATKTNGNTCHTRADCLLLRVGLCHVLAVPRGAVVPGAGAVIDTRPSVHPHFR